MVHAAPIDEIVTRVQYALSMGRPFVIRAHSPAQLGQIARLRLIDPCTAGGFRHTRLGGPQLAQGTPTLLADGQEEICEVGKGFLITVGSTRIAQDWFVRCRSVEEALRIRILQAGHASFEVGSGSAGASMACCSYAIQPPGSWMSVHYRGGELLRLINLSVTRRYLRETLGLADEELPGVLLRHWRAAACSFGTLRLSRGTQALAASLFHRKGRGGWHNVWLRSASTQLLTSVFDDWLSQQDASGAPVKLSVRDTDRLALAVELIKSTLTEPLTAADLVRRTGLNRNKLHFGLRQLVGMSASAYYAHLRMQRALALVSASEHSISRISEMLGFSEHTNFTSVFRKHFGATPRELRREVPRIAGSPRKK